MLSRIVFSDIFRSKSRISRLPGGSGAILLALLWAVASTAIAQNDDVIGFPDSRVVATEELQADEETRVIISQVSEVRNRLRFSDALVLPGEGSRRLLQVPSDYALQDVVDHYQEALQVRDARMLFSCDGRGCGRSAVWANSVFDQSRLYGRDSDQAYLVGAWRDDQNHLRVLSVYLVRRGNRNISVLEQQLTLPEDYRLPGANPRERQVLGPFVIPFEAGAIPRLTLPPETGNDIRSLAERYPEAVVYLVGFAPPAPDGPEAAMEQSQLALEAAGRLLEGSGVADDRQIPIAVGAAVPVDDPQRQGYRVEVTLIREEIGSDG